MEQTTLDGCLRVTLMVKALRKELSESTLISRKENPRVSQIKYKGVMEKNGKNI